MQVHSMREPYGKPLYGNGFGNSLSGGVLSVVRPDREYVVTYDAEIMGTATLRDGRTITVFVDQDGKVKRLGLGTGEWRPDEAKAVWEAIREFR